MRPALTGACTPARTAQRAFRALQAVAAALLLAACSLPPAQPPVTVYDFGGQVPAAGPEGVAGQPGLPGGVQVQAPPWLDGNGIVYRLAYADAARLASYRDSRWAAPPAALLHEALRQRIARSAGVPGPTSLRVEIEEFAQVFDDPARSRGVVRLRAAVLDADGRRVLRTQVVVQAVDALTPDAAGGAHALAQAAARAAARVMDWAAAKP